MEEDFYLLENYMTKLKLLIVALVVGVVFILWVPAWHWETTESQDNVEVSTWDIVEEQIIYTFEMTKDYLKERVDALVGDYNISSAIVEECTTQVPDDYKKCIKDLIWVSNAESTIFKNWMYPSNNGFWLMYKGHKRRFTSVEESIKVWVSLYVKNNWVDRATAKDWLRWNYCTSECSHRTKNFNRAVNKLELD